MISLSAPLSPRARYPEPPRYCHSPAPKSETWNTLISRLSFTLLPSFPRHRKQTRRGKHYQILNTPVLYKAQITFHTHSLELNNALLASGPNSLPRLSEPRVAQILSAFQTVWLSLTNRIQPLAFLFLEHNDLIYSLLRYKFLNSSTKSMFS